MGSVAAAQARSALPELLTRVEDGEEIVITRHGRAVAVLVRPDALRSRRAQPALDSAERIHDLLAEAAAGAGTSPGVSGVTAQRAEELIREIRLGRTSR